MEFAAVYHRPRSEFAHAVEEGRFVFRLRAAHGMLKGCALHYTDRAPLDPGVSFARLPMARVRADAYGDWYEAELRTELKRVGYCFELEAEDGIWYYYGDCFERQLPRQRYECFQFPYDHRADRLEVPAWAADAVVYNIFPDSFASGRAAICGEGTEKPWNGEMCASRLGGTVEGVRLNLGYIRDLGCNCVYLNPVFAADSYHKYDLLDYFHVDPCMGTDAQFRALVDEAHGMGLRVIIDGVFNHTSWRHPFFQDVLRRGKASPFWRYYYSLPEDVRFPAKGEAPGYACFSYVPQMPKTDTAYPPLRDYFCAVGAHWVREYDVDGWRLDVANEVDDGFLRAFRRAVKGAKRDAIIIGEVWENASHYLQGDMMDSAMNYDFRRFCQRFFAEGSIGAEDFDARVSVLLMRYQRQAAFAQLNLLDSHDVSQMCIRDRANSARPQSVEFGMNNSASKMPNCAEEMVAPVVGETNLFMQSCCMMSPATLMPTPVQRMASRRGSRETTRIFSCSISPPNSDGRSRSMTPTNSEQTLATIRQMPSMMEMRWFLMAVPLPCARFYISFN